MKAFILAADKEEKLEPITDNMPKAMIRILGKPLIEYWIKELKRNGIKEIGIIVGYKRELIEDYLGKGDRYGVNIEYIVQEKQLGVEDALSRIKCDEESFIVVYSDIFTEPGMISRLLNTYYNYGGKPSFCVTLSRETREYGVTVIDEKGRIVKVYEKKVVKEAGNYVIAGAYIITSGILKRIKDGYSLAEALNKEVEKGENIYATIWEKEWVDVGWPWHILEANKLAQKRIRRAVISSKARIEGGAIIEGPVIIRENAHVETGAILRGPCYVDKGAYIGNHSLVRKNTYIGRESIIGFGVEVKNAIIMDKVKIGRLSYIGDSYIGFNVDIGAGATTVNVDISGKTIKMKIKGRVVDTKLEKLGTIIGDNSRIGANVTIMPGVKISSNKLVQPGLIVREDL